MLVVYSFWYECIQLVELFFNRMISVKSSEINKLYEKFNRLISLKTKQYKLSFRKLRHDFEFLSVKISHSSMENTFSLNHTAASVRLKILVNLGGILAWLELEELEFGWLGRATIRFYSSCASCCVPDVILGV